MGEKAGAERRRAAGKRREPRFGAGRGRAMLTRTAVWASVVSVLLSTPLTVSFAQQTPERGARISLGAVSGTPKGQVMVPFYLTPAPPGTEVGEIGAAISCEGNSVSFLRAEKGFLLDGVRASSRQARSRAPAVPASLSYGSRSRRRASLENRCGKDSCCS